MQIRAKFLSYAPVLTVSALTGQRVQRIFPAVDEIHQQYSRRITTGQLNRIVQEAIERTPPPYYRGSRLKFYYATQIAAKPPRIICFVNHPGADQAGNRFGQGAYFCEPQAARKPPQAGDGPEKKAQAVTIVKHIDRHKKTAINYVE
jgi:hypothetical protein